MTSFVHKGVVELFRSSDHYVFGAKGRQVLIQNGEGASADLGIAIPGAFVKYDDVPGLREKLPISLEHICHFVISRGDVSLPPRRGANREQGKQEQEAFHAFTLR